MTIPANDREAIWVALLAHLNSTLAGQFKTIGRRHVMPPELTPAQQPALFLVQTKEGRNPQPFGTGGKLTLEGMLIVYLVDGAASVATGKETNLAATKLNAMLKTIDEAFGPDHFTGAARIFTIGGLVYSCWIEGTTDMDQGVFGQQACAVIPLKISVP